MSTCYDDNSKYYVIDLSNGASCVTTWETLEEARACLQQRMYAGALPGELFLIHGEKVKYQYQKNIVIKFEGEGTDP